MITRENYEIWMLDYAEGKLSPAQQKQFLAFLEQNPDLQNELEAFEPIALPKAEDQKPPAFNLHKKQSWLLEKYSPDELVFHYNEGNLGPEELREWNDLVKTMPQLLQQAHKEKQLVLKPQAGETFGEKALLKREEGVYNLTLQNYNAYFIQFHETKELALHMAIKAFLVQQPQLRAEFEQYGKLVLKADTRVVFAEKDTLRKKEKAVAFYWWQYAAVAASVLLAIWFFYPANQDPNVLQASNPIDSTEQINVPGQHHVSPQDVIAKQNDVKKETEQPKENGSSNLANQQEKHNKKDRNQKQELPLKEERMPDQMVKENEPKPIKDEKDRQAVKDSVMVPVRTLEKQEQPVADNKEKKAPAHNNIQTVNGPTELVSAVFNKKYYEEQTPHQETSSAFYAMRNVVHSVSGGEADMQRKEDKNTKEFSLKIGNFGFSRKKHKSSGE